MANRITITVEGIPAPQGSKTAYKRGGRIVLVETSKKLAPWRNTVANTTATQMKQQHATTIPTGVPVKLDLLFTLTPPKSARKNTRDYVVRRPDLDKLIRAVNDALTGIAYADDNQVAVIHTSKRYGPTPGVHITITPLNQEPQQ